MNRHTALTLVMAGLFGSAALVAQGFNVRTGAWQMTVTIVGMPKMEGIPPAMRAQMEAEMRKPRTVTACITADDVKSLNLGKIDDDDKNCKVVSSKITPTVGDVVRQCTGDEPRTETAHFETSSPQAMKATVASKSADDSQTVSLVGKWLSADCKE